MIELFRQGTSHIVNGITCERNIVNEFGFEHLLKEGWFFTPEECYSTATSQEKKIPVTAASQEKKVPVTAASQEKASKLVASENALKAPQLKKPTTKSGSSGTSK